MMKERSSWFYYKSLIGRKRAFAQIRCLAAVQVSQQAAFRPLFSHYNRKLISTSNTDIQKRTIKKCTPAGGIGFLRGMVRRPKVANIIFRWCMCTRNVPKLQSLVWSARVRERSCDVERTGWMARCEWDVCKRRGGEEEDGCDLLPTGRQLPCYARREDPARPSPAAPTPAWTVLHGAAARGTTTTQWRTRPHTIHGGNLARLQPHTSIKTKPQKRLKQMWRTYNLY